MCLVKPQRYFVYRCRKSNRRPGGTPAVTIKRRHLRAVRCTTSWRRPSSQPSWPGPSWRQPSSGQPSWPAPSWRSRPWRLSSELPSWRLSWPGPSWRRLSSAQPSWPAPERRPALAAGFGTDPALAAIATVLVSSVMELIPFTTRVDDEWTSHHRVDVHAAAQSPLMQRSGDGPTEG